MNTDLVAGIGAGLIWLVMVIAVLLYTGKDDD